MDQEKWGWCLRKGQFEPKTMDLPMAPDSLLKLVRCQCKGNCDTQRCSCKRNELECSSACDECKGVCQNSNFDASTDDQVNTNSYHEWHNCFWMTSYYVMVTSYHICNAHSVFLEFILNLCKLTTFPKTLSLIHIWRCRRSTLCRSRWSPYH